MNDCMNAEIRDQLPDLLHERLDPATRALVMAHVETCADCRDELALLRGMQDMLTQSTPRVDVPRIVQSLPSSYAAPQKRWLSWRLAAAAAVIAVAGTSLTLIRNRDTSVPATDSLVGAATPVAPVDTQPTRSPERTVVATTNPVDSQRQPSHAVARGTDNAGGRELEMTGRLSELTNEELETLLKEIDEMEALPLTEPEPAVVPITTRRNVSTPGT
jgi:hypothetical protein